MTRRAAPFKLVPRASIGMSRTGGAANESWAHAFADVNGVRLHYVRAGEPGRPLGRCAGS